MGTDDTYAQQALNEANVKIAVLEAQAIDRDKAIACIFTTLEAMDRKVSAISSTLSEAKGGWRVLMLFGGAGGAVGAALAWFFSHVTLRGI